MLVNATVHVSYSMFCGHLVEKAGRTLHKDINKNCILTTFCLNLQQQQQQKDC